MRHEIIISKGEKRHCKNFLHAFAEWIKERRSYPILRYSIPTSSGSITSTVSTYLFFPSRRASVQSGRDVPEYSLITNHSFFLTHRNFAVCIILLRCSNLQSYLFVLSSRENDWPSQGKNSHPVVHHFLRIPKRRQ